MRWFMNDHVETKYKQSCTFLEQKKITKVDDYSTPIEGKTKS